MKPLYQLIALAVVPVMCLSRCSEKPLCEMVEGNSSMIVQTGVVQYHPGARSYVIRVVPTNPHQVATDGAEVYVVCGDSLAVFEGMTISFKGNAWPLSADHLSVVYGGDTHYLITVSEIEPVHNGL